MISRIFAAKIAYIMCKFDLKKSNPIAITVMVKPKEKNNVNQGSLLLVTFIAGKEYIPPISIPTTRKPNVYIGIFFSRDPCSDM